MVGANQVFRIESLYIHGYVVHDIRVTEYWHDIEPEAV